MPDWDLTPLPGSARDVTPNLSGTESFRWTPDNHEYRQIAGGGYADDTAGQARFDATAHQAVPGGEMLGNINPDGTMNNGGGDIAKAQASMRAYVAQRQAALGPPGAATAPAPTPAPVYADRAISLGSSAPPVYTTKTPMADPPPTVDRAQPVPQMAPAPMPLTPAAAAAQAAPAAPTADPAQLTTMLSPCSRCFAAAVVGTRVRVSRSCPCYRVRCGR